ncbi:uncharacterized protein [Coffea arabica]|uniref:Uncharacterized protein isoform X2 n=1 Tax=Coffea arabica TaxID=13443 RepID=A0ABM4VRY6_COFAR
MGEEKKEEANKEEQKKQVPGNKEDTSKKEEEGDKKEEKKEEEVQEIVLKVDMHCEACARKVTRALKGFQGVESVTADCKGSKVVVKGKSADPVKVCERIHRKSGRKVELISPLPKPLEEAPKAPVEEKKTEEAIISKRRDIIDTRGSSQLVTLARLKLILILEGFPFLLFINWKSPSKKKKKKKKKNIPQAYDETTPKLVFNFLKLLMKRSQSWFWIEYYFK